MEERIKERNRKRAEIWALKSFRDRSSSEYGGRDKKEEQKKSGNSGLKSFRDRSQFRLELRGRMPNAESDSYYAVLTDNKNLTFEDVSKSLYGSLLEDSKIMEGSIIVEMR
ncbi:hypothetical protein FMM80_29405 [Schaedlerella arabinosiphila]|uniref:Uncharacterized protein n=1 Tax=Schaedlerella arabinosiphila TaxID=2044587 RepID=A0A9X5CFT3_9FIRM|nr:hypothetical protein [Schaedlerella arabinosiphila]NDO72522.1 hypothetical protein [Schaedlerella arabinosiphila]